MSKAYIHPATQRQLDTLLEDFPQSLLIKGAAGVGFHGVLGYIEERLQVTPHIVLPEKDEKVDLDKGTIGVALIRRLYDLSKTVETNKRVIVIDYAERMGTGAQNAFLKLLEEPGANTHFILLSHAPEALLPTITSRTQHLDVRPLANQQTSELLDSIESLDAQKRAQLMFIANGLPAELLRLSSDTAYFEQRIGVVKDARTLLQAGLYEKLAITQKYKDNRSLALTLLTDCAKLLKKTIADGHNPEIVKKISAFLDAYDRIQANGNVRLHLAATVV